VLEVFPFGSETFDRSERCGMSGGSEMVLGELHVVARLAIGVERLRLIFTGSRIILAHEGKRGTGAHAGAAFLGFLSSGLEDIIRGGKDSLSRKRAKGSSPHETLASQKDNFSISYDEIVNVALNELEYTNRIVVVTRDDKFEFTTGSRIDHIVSLFEKGVGDRVMTTRLAR